MALGPPRPHVKNRVDKILDDATIKLASGVSDVCGVRARRMLAALLGGERGPKKRAVRARGSLRGKIPQFEVALEGQWTAHHAPRLAGALAWVDVLGRQIAAIAPPLDALRREMGPQLEPLVSLPGGNAMPARDLIAAIGVDLQRFGSASRLASLVGRGGARQRREGGYTAPGATPHGHSVSAPGAGALCLGDAEDVKLCGSDVSPPGGTFG